jgi:hypothetical protein
MALTDAPGEVELWEPEDDQLSSISPAAARGRSVDTAGPNLRHHIREGTTIDAFSESRSLNPDVIKIDVEGAEGQVLRGADRFLSARRGRLLIEVHPWALERFGDTTDGILATVDNAGWECALIHERGEVDDPAATLHYACRPRVEAD